MLKIKHLIKTIQTKKILNDLNFEIQRGEIGIFLGGSGVGKSTLLRVLNNLEAYDTGEFILDENRLNLSEVNKKHHIGMVFQHFNLFEHLTVEENISLALKKQGKSNQEALQISNELLKRYGLIEKAQINVQKLSGGQKQRVAIARTLALNPQIICMDEPTSALDPLLTSQVAKFIHELAQENRIVLIATHDMHLVEKLNGKIFLMQEGQIIETVTTQEYRSNPNATPNIHAFLNG